MTAFQDLGYAKQAAQTDDTRRIQTRHVPVAETRVFVFVYPQVLAGGSLFRYTSTVITYHLLHLKDKKINSAMNFFNLSGFSFSFLFTGEVQLEPKLTDTLAVLFVVELFDIEILLHFNYSISFKFL